MARIFYSMCGHGRGHATRVRAVVEQLRGDHDFFLYCPGDAYTYLSELYKGSENVRVFPLEPALRFEYRANRVSMVGTLRNVVKYLWRLKPNIRRLCQEIRQHRADLALSDLEPILPRAARKAGLPYISLDNHHRFVIDDRSRLPLKLRWFAFLTSLYVKACCSGQAGMIVSTFYHLQPRRRYRDRVRLIGPLLRPVVVDAIPRDDGFILVYLRESIPARILDVLKQCGRDVRVYGLGQRSADGNLVFKPLSEAEFVADLAACHAIVSTAGHQLIAETRYLRKPVLLLPEVGHSEQMTNAFFLQSSGGGMWADARTVGIEDLQRFLASVDSFRYDQPELGNRKVQAAVESFLGESSQAASSGGGSIGTDEQAPDFSVRSGDEVARS